MPGRIVRWTAPAIEENLAFEEALHDAVEENPDEFETPIVRLWEWPRWTIVLGATGRVALDVNDEARARDGVPLARRASGGGTVLLGPGVRCATVILPVDAEPAFRAVDTAQVAVLEKLAGALRDSGRPVVVRGSGDLALEDRKFAGSAQRRKKRFFLVHASVLLDADLDRIPKYLKIPARQPEYRRGRSHAEFLANLNMSVPEFDRAVLKAWADPDSREWVPDPESRPRAAARGLAADRFAREDWIRRF